MSESFYPFVENGREADGQDIAPPLYTARIAVYDAMTVPPRVVTVPPSDVRTYLDEITKNVWELATQQGGDWPFHIIRELVENYIHASFIEPTVSIMDKGQTISFSDQGPGIPNKQAALRPTFSSATAGMKRYIRGTGSGLPMVEAQVKLQHGSITIEDNLNQGVVVTVSLVNKDQAVTPEQPYPPAQGQQGQQPQVTPTHYQQQPQPWQDPRFQAVQGQGQQPYYQPGYMPMPGYQQQQPNPYYGYGYPVQQPVHYPAAGYQPAMPATPYPAFPAVPNPNVAAQTPAANGMAVAVSDDFRRILALFLMHEKIGATEVSESLGLSKPTGTRRLKEMGEAGLIQKSGQKYVPTAQGRELLATISIEG